MRTGSTLKKMKISSVEKNIRSSSNERIVHLIKRVKAGFEDDGNFLSNGIFWPFRI